MQSVLACESIQALALLPPQLVLSIGRFFESNGQMKEAASLYKLYSSNGVSNDFSDELKELQNIYQAKMLAFDI